jgi:hypothetical protein
LISTDERPRALTVSLVLCVSRFALRSFSNCSKWQVTSTTCQRRATSIWTGWTVRVVVDHSRLSWRRKHADDAYVIIRPPHTCNSLRRTTTTTEDKYIENFRPTLMEVVYLVCIELDRLTARSLSRARFSLAPRSLARQWSKGMSFQSICDATDVFEGSVVRALRRLVELLDSLERAAEVVGDVELSARFEKSKMSIRRGLPFAASLYI